MMLIHPAANIFSVSRNDVEVYMYLFVSIYIYICIYIYIYIYILHMVLKISIYLSIILHMVLKISMTYVVRCAIWYHLYNLKNVKNTHRGVLLLVKLQASAFKLYKWYKSRKASHVKCWNLGEVRSAQSR